MNIYVFCSRRIKSGDTPTITLQISVAALVLLARLYEKKKERRKEDRHIMLRVCCMRSFFFGPPGVKMKKNAAHTDEVLSFKKTHTQLQFALSFSNSSPAPPTFPFLAVLRYLTIKRNSHKFHFLLLFGSCLSLFRNYFYISL